MLIWLGRKDPLYAVLLAVLYVAGGMLALEIAPPPIAWAVALVVFGDVAGCWMVAADRWCRRRRRQASCFHHDPITSTTHINHTGCTTDDRKVYWCGRCQRRWVL